MIEDRSCCKKERETVVEERKREREREREREKERERGVRAMGGNSEEEKKGMRNGGKQR